MNTSCSISLASFCHSWVFRSSNSGTQLALPIIFIVPATSQSCSQIPGVVGLGVVVVVDVVVVLDVTSVIGISDTDEIVAVRAASSIFSIEIGVVDELGHPVNSVVALQKVQRRINLISISIHIFK